MQGKARERKIQRAKKHALRRRRGYHRRLVIFLGASFIEEVEGGLVGGDGRVGRLTASIEFIGTHCRQDIRSRRLRVKWAPVPPVNKSLRMRVSRGGRALYACVRCLSRASELLHTGRRDTMRPRHRPRFLRAIYNRTGFNASRVGRPRTKRHPVVDARSCEARRRTRSPRRRRSSRERKRTPLSCR